MENNKRIIDAFKRLNLDLTDSQARQFMRYYELLVEKNKVMNLTAIVEFEDVVVKHFLDSLMLCKVMEAKGRLLDVGTGAGFPGIPLKIVYPDLEVVLLDSLNKRVQFLREVIEDLGLNGIEAVHGRAEDLARQGCYRERFDICVSRAVAHLASLSEYCLPFVTMDGYFVSYKSGKIQEELEEGAKAVKVLGGKLEQKLEILIPGTEVSRCLLQIKKIKHTSGKYPRKAGIPTKEPIR